MRTASEQAKAIVKATAPVIEKHGLAITTAMYARLFRNAEVAAMFDQAAQDSGEQPRRLAAAILAYAQNIDKLEALAAPVMRMAARHVDRHIVGLLGGRLWRALPARVCRLTATRPG